MPHLNCGRCGYNTNRMSSLKTHLTKKKACEPVYSNVDRLVLLEALNTPQGKDMCKGNVVLSTKIVPYAEIDDKETYTMQMQHDNVKLKHENSALKNANAELTSKLQTLQASGGAASVTNNNNNTNNINITHIHINNFGHENTDYITDDFLLSTMKTAYDSVPTLLKHIHFNPAHPENHNVRMPNKRDKYMQVRRKGQWIHENRRVVIDHLMDNGHCYIISRDNDKIVERLPEDKRKSFDRYINKMNSENDDVMSEVRKNIEIMLLNTRTV